MSMSMNNMKQIFQNKFTKLKIDKNDDRVNIALPSYTDSLYQLAKTNKEMCNDIYKKMSNVYVTEDKKTKKNSWETLSSVLSDAEKKAADDILTKDILTTSIKAFDELSRNTKDFEKNISCNVIKHFQELSEDNSLSSIKKAITSLSKDMKANADKVMNLQEQINNQSELSTNRKSMDISNIGSTENKLVNAQLAEENSEKELDLKKDLYLTKLFCSEADKVIIAEKMLEFFKEHLEYYIDCKNTLTKSIPELQIIIDNSKKNYVFHLSLDEHIQSTNRKLSYVLETCIHELDNEETLQEEGLFRISGSKNKLELLKNALNVMRADDYIIKNCDSAVFAGVLKQYLRELPIPLMTFNLYDKWVEVGAKIKNNDVDGAKDQIKECLSQMPSCYYDNLVHLMEFLKKIALNESVNKMNSSNLALMLGPNLIRNKQANDNDDSDASRVMILGSPGPGVVDFMITFCYDLFPEIPVYTASKPKPNVLQIIKSPDKESERSKILKSPRNYTDNDSLSSADMLSDDSTIPVSTSDPASGSKFDTTTKSQKEAILRSKAPRKPPAPPPPVLKFTNADLNTDNITDEIKVKDTFDSRPAIKKRTSILEKSLNEKYNSEITPTDNSLKRSTTNFVPSKPVQAPSVPIKKPSVLPISESSEKCRQKVESAPPKRPNNPPPPIPSFDKLKETLDQKTNEGPPYKMELRKPSLPTVDDTSKSNETESLESKISNSDNVQSKL